MAEKEADEIRRMRHDLSNPLAAILAEVQLLLLNESGFDPDTVQSLREIEALARRMREMLHAAKPAG